MRTIHTIIVHCSATVEGEHVSAKIIDRWHRTQGYNSIGYHYVIQPNGIIERGRSEESVGAHCKGHNLHSIGICYVGGLDMEGNPKDTRTPAQKESLSLLIEDICNRHPIKSIGGHRDFSPDLNGNGIIERHEWVKACPCFEVREEWGGQQPFHFNEKTRQ